jgi:hypothetical protein
MFVMNTNAADENQHNQQTNAFLKPFINAGANQLL